MLNAIVALALKFRGIVVILAALVMVYGVFVAQRSTLDVFPDFVPPQVTIQTEAPGLSPDEVESLITFPIESAIGGIAGLEATRSDSIQGLSVVNVIFKENTDLLVDRQLLSERLIEIGNSLPAQAKAPTMSPMVSSTMDLLKIGLVSDTTSLRELRSLADWTIRPALKSISGVAEVTVVGGEAEELSVVPQLDAMAAHGISLVELQSALFEATGIRGAGYVETANQRLTLRANGPFADPESIAGTVLRSTKDDIIYVGDVADASYGAMPKFGDVLINGKAGVLLAMTSQYGANTLVTTRAVEKALQELKPALEASDVTLWDSLHRPANFIEVALSHLTESLLIGGALVAVVLLVFLLDLRTAFISFVSIPLSLLAAVIAMEIAGISLNTMTLGGLAVAIGVVVDDAIIDVENILRRLRANSREKTAKPIAKVVLDASIEVRGSVIYATMVVLAVFLPVFALSGLQGRFFAPLGISFILAVAASLLTALTVTPALCLLMLGRSRPHNEPFYIRWIKEIHGRCLKRLCKTPIVTGMTGFLLVGGAFWMLGSVQTELLPPFREGHFVLQAFGVPGSSLEETMRFGKSVSDKLLAMPEIKTVEMQAGRSEKGVDTWGPERCEFHVELKPDTSIDEGAVQQRIRDVMESYGNVQTETLTFLGDRIGESLSGETAAVAISVFGPDLSDLDKIAGQVLTIVNTVPGATEARSGGQSLAPGLRIDLSSENLRELGLRPVAVLETIQTAFQGVEVAQIYEGNRIIPITLRLSQKDRSTIETVESLLLSTPTGEQVRLGRLGQIYVEDQRSSISHEGGSRRQVVTTNVSGRSVSEFVREAKRRIESAIKLPKGVYLSYGGAAQAEAATHRELLVSTGATLALIGLFLSSIFRSARNLTLVLANLPFAIAGGIVAIYLSGLPLSLGALVGFITLIGLSTRNAIMLMTHYQHLMEVGKMHWNLNTVLQGARERVVPVVMTAAVTGLAILPLALSPTSAGREIEGPMAVAILGGLVSSTLMTLLILPALTWKFGRFNSN